MEDKLTTLHRPIRGLGLMDASLLIIGSMIGSGIFIVSADIARDVQTPALLLLNWGLAGFITILGALSYGELAAAMPKAGGQYIYLKEAYNKLFGFLYGWTLFTVIQTGTIAAVAVAFAKYTGVFFPAISAGNHVLEIGSFSISTQQVLGIACIMLLTFFNYNSVKKGAILQNIFTFAKVAALLALVVLGFSYGFGGEGNAGHFHAPASSDGSGVGLGIFFAAMVGSLFSMDAWNNVTFTAGEVRNPQRNLPRSLLIGTGTVIVIYLLANIAYLYILPIDKIQNAPNGRVAAVMMEEILGAEGLYFIAAMVMVSTFGCLNGIILSGARVYYAMAKDGLFFKQAAKLNKNEVPANSLLAQGLWASALTLTGSYGELLNYVMFAVVLFYILTIAGIFILRRTQPLLERPYKALGYPVVPGLYILLASGFCLSLLLSPLYRNYALGGFIIVGAGIPVYYLVARLGGGLNNEPKP